MVRTRTSHIILWPSYFDAAKSRARGRRVPKSLALQNPTSEELLAAAESLGFETTLHTDKSYPGAWWDHEGCIAVEKTLRKTDLIEKLAPKLKQLRQAAAPNQKV